MLHRLSLLTLTLLALSLPFELETPWLTLEWRESGGPEPAEPAQTGFGSKLLHIMIERTLDGNVTRSFEPGGLVCTLSFPLKKTAGGT